MNCHLFRRHLDAYNDGELDPSAQVDFERHAAMCVGCQERLGFARAFKRSVKQEAQTVHAPLGLRERMMHEMSKAEAARPPRDSFVLPTRYGVPLAIAAAVAMAFMSNSKQGTETTAASIVPMFQDVVRSHSAPLRADVESTESAQVVSFFRDKVEFPVRPARFEHSAARLIGGRLTNVREQRAAALYYDWNGRRVTVVVFRGVPDSHWSAPVHVDGRDVYLQNVGGYAVSLVPHDGVMYAFTGDVDQKTLIQLAGHAQVQ